MNTATFLIPTIFLTGAMIIRNHTAAAESPDDTIRPFHIKQRRPLRGVGTAGTLRRGNARSVQIIALTHPGNP